MIGFVVDSVNAVVFGRDAGGVPVDLFGWVGGLASDRIDTGRPVVVCPSCGRGLERSNLWVRP